MAKEAIGDTTHIPCIGPVVHADRFRKWLGGHGEDSDIKLFLDGAVAEGGIGPLGRLLGITLCTVPIELTSWVAQSRRIYSPDVDLQALLNATKLDGILWSDVPWPFDAFGLVLPDPLIDKRKGAKYDFLLMHRIKHEVGERKVDVLQFRLISTGVGNALLPQHLKNAVSEAVHARRPDRLKLFRLFEQCRSQFARGHTAVFSFRGDLLTGAKVTDSVSDLLFRQHDRICECGGRHPEYDQAVRLAVGMSLYLKTLHGGSPPRWKRYQRRGMSHRDPLMGEAQLCEIASEHKLSVEDRTAFLGDGAHVGMKDGEMDVPAHFRRGHWRRMPGKAGDDDAPRHVLVKPCHIPAYRRRLRAPDESETAE